MLVYIIFVVHITNSLGVILNSTNTISTQTIAFGSCFKFYRNHDTDVFQRIGSFNPTHFLWLGDAAYIDYMPVLGIWFPERNESRVREKFEITSKDRYYSEFKKSTIIKGIYDDHDSNENNGGMFNPLKESAKQLYLDFLEEPLDSPLRKQDGIYNSFYIDENFRILIVMTDIRYNSNVYTGDSLGENQWKWLEQQFQKESQLIILTSGVQVLPDDRSGPESWFLPSKERLYNLIRKYKKPIILLSGDVHYSEMLRYPCPQKIGQELYEFTSSGMTFANHDHIPFVDIIFKFLFPTTYSSYDDHYYKSNFGILKFTFNNTNVNKIIYETHSSKDSSIVLTRELLISELSNNLLNEQQECILNLDPKERRKKNYKLRAIEHKYYLLGALISIITIFSFCIWNCVSYIKEFKRLY